MERPGAPDRTARVRPNGRTRHRGRPAREALEVTARRRREFPSRAARRPGPSRREDGGTLRSTLVSSLAALALALGLVLGAAAPSEAQPVDQEGLVNVNLGDVTVQVPVAIAANICDVAVNVLAEYERDGEVFCDAVANSEARSEGRGQGQGPVNQEGLINLNVGNVTVQVPVALAANICGIPISVLANVDIEGETNCEALAEAVADA